MTPSQPAGVSHLLSRAPFLCSRLFTLGWGCEYWGHRVGLGCEQPGSPCHTPFCPTPSPSLRLSAGPSSELRMLPSPSSVSSSRSLWGQVGGGLSPSHHGARRPLPSAPCHTKLCVGDSDVLLKLERFISARDVP